MSAYSDRDLISKHSKTYVIEPFEEGELTPLGYDLTVGFALTWDTQGSIQTLNYKQRRPVSADKKTDSPEAILTIPPKTGFIVIPAEKVYLSGKVSGEIKAKSRISARGIYLNPLTIDPNFGRDGGRLILYLYNASNEKYDLTERDGIATLTIHTMKTITDLKPRTASFARTLEHYRKIYSLEVAAALSEYVDYFSLSRGDKQFEDSAEQLDMYWKLPWGIRHIHEFGRSLVRHWRIEATLVFGFLMIFLWILLKDYRTMYGYELTWLLKGIELLGAVAGLMLLHRFIPSAHK